MKKLLTILLALLVVTGVVFADGDDPTVPASDPFTPYSPSGVAAGDTTLTLQSTIKGEFEHGFAREVTGDFDYGSYSRNVFVNGVSDGEGGAEAQSIGHYYIKTNASSIVNVAFTVNAMKNTTLASGDIPTDFHVGYKFAYAKNTDSSAGERFSVVDGFIELRGAGDNESDLVASGSGVNVITSSATGGYGKLVLDLTATFNVNEDLPEGDYLGTIVADVTVT